MAITSIWRVGGRLGEVVIYVENPDKAENPATYEKSDMEGRDAQGPTDVIGYAVQQQKTERAVANDEGTTIIQRFVSGVNCSPSTARDEMVAVRKRFGKENDTVAYHDYQSFAPGEADPQITYEIRLKLAKKLWDKEYQVVVATRLDKSNHLHNHFVTSTVSFMDGIKYHHTEKDYYDMQRESDRLCQEYGLSVIENPQRGKSQHYGVWRAEQEGRPTYLSLVKADVGTAIRQSMTERQSFYHLRQMGYDIKVGKDITLRAPGKENGRKLCRNLDEEYSLGSIRRRILVQSHPQRTHRPHPQRYRLHGDLKQAREVTGFRALYFHYCYLLSASPQKQNRQPQRISRACREDLIRAKELTDETRLLFRHHIDVLEQLAAHRRGAESEMNADIKQQRALYCRLRTKEVRSAPEQCEQTKAEIAVLSGRIKKLRREVGLCEDIAIRFLSIKERIKAAREEARTGQGARQGPEQGRAGIPGRR